MAGTSQSSNPPYKIQRVPPLLLEEEKNKRDYYPKAVSIGPYHHGMVALASVEAFKAAAVDLFTSGDGRENNDFYYNHIYEMIPQVKKCYEENPTVKYSDPDLAKMMLRDASLIIIFMEISAPIATQLVDQPARDRKYSAMLRSLGRLTIANLLRDFFLMENQIPLCVIMLLIKLRHGEGEDQKLLDGFLNMTMYGEKRQKREYFPVQEANKAEQPLHLLEAFHRLIVSDCVKKTSSVCFKCRWLCCAPPPPTGGAAASPTCFTCTFLCCSRDKKEASFDPEIGVGPAISYANHGLIHRFVMFLTCKRSGAAKAKGIKKLIHSFRSVTDLKAKGIYFKPSPTQSLKDVNFKSHLFYASVELPEWGVSIYTKVFFLNLVAYELSPENPTKAEVSSYINLMKSLIERPEDVKELRERRIFYNMLGSDEEVLSVYGDINTHGAENGRIFRHVKDEIQAHYNSRMKTWMAELIHTNFRSPWTITAFVAAIALLAISAGQLYYAVHPN